VRVLGETTQAHSNASAVGRGPGWHAQVVAADAAEAAADAADAAAGHVAVVPALAWLTAQLLRMPRMLRQMQLLNVRRHFQCCGALAPECAARATAKVSAATSVVMMVPIAVAEHLCQPPRRHASAEILVSRQPNAGAAETPSEAMPAVMVVACLLPMSVAQH